MKIAEFLRTLADLVDTESAIEQPTTPAVEIFAQDPEITAQDTEMEELSKLAGITRASTTPCEEVFPVQSVVPAGNDMHKSKNPSDMRTDSISLYPGYGAKD